MKKLIKNQFYFIMLGLFCLISLQSTTINSPIIVHGYIDRMEPAVILLESRQEEIIVEKVLLPPNSAEGLWVDVVICHDTHKVIRINEKKTSYIMKRVTELRKEIYNK